MTESQPSQSQPQPHIDLSKLSYDEILRLKAAIKARKRSMTYGQMADKICDMPPDEAKEVLCNMARDVEQQSIEGGWQKIVLNAIKREM